MVTRSEVVRIETEADLSEYQLPHDSGLQLVESEGLTGSEIAWTILGVVSAQSLAAAMEVAKHLLTRERRVSFRYQELEIEASSIEDLHKVAAAIDSIRQSMGTGVGPGIVEDDEIVRQQNPSD